MQKDPYTEHAFLDTAEFPLVTIKEVGALDDEERHVVFDWLEELLACARPHAFVLDLSECGPLADHHRAFIAETLQLWHAEIEPYWISFAILIDDSAGPRAEIAAFWRSVLPVPSQLFTNRMSALIWSRQQRAKELSPSAASATSPASAPPAPAPARRPPRPRQRMSRPSREVWGSGGEAPLLVGRLLRWSLLALGVGGLLWLLLAPPVENRRFAAHRVEVTMRAFCAADVGELALVGQAKCPPKARLRFELDLPAVAHVLLLGVRPSGYSYVALPVGGVRSMGPISAGRRLRLPAKVELDESTGAEWFHVIVCPESIRRAECLVKRGGAHIECPESCEVRSLRVEKREPS